MGHYVSGFAATCNHDITYQFTCQKCGVGVGPVVRGFEHSAAVPQHAQHLPLTDTDRIVLINVGNIRLVALLAGVYRGAVSKTQDAYSLHVFENLCPHCGKYQDWSTVKGLLRKRRVEKLSEKSFPIIDWRLEQLSEDMRAFFAAAVRDERQAADEEARLLFEALLPGANAALVTDVLGETMYEAAPFQSVRQHGAPNLHRGETALGYYIHFGLRWFVLREGRIARVV